MKKENISDLSISQLITQFEMLGIKQMEAREAERFAKYNQLFMEMQDVVRELKMRPGDQRHALLTLYTHPNIQVRLRVAKNTYALAPLEARRILEGIHASNWYPYAADAAGMLMAVDNGSYKPE